MTPDELLDAETGGGIVGVSCIASPMVDYLIAAHLTGNRTALPLPTSLGR
jgi:hypothetical protein